MKEFFKNVGEGAMVIGRKVAKPAIGIATAAVTTVGLYLIGKKSRQNNETGDEADENEEEIEETEGTEEEEDESDESEEA